MKVIAIRQVVSMMSFLFTIKIFLAKMKTNQRRDCSRLASSEMGLIFWNVDINLLLKVNVNEKLLIKADSSFSTA